jgi:3'(2'), 5'-bisphosphate nucleotidase
MILDDLKIIARDAGKAIIEVYDRDEEITITTKDNDSPLTEADLAAHRVRRDQRNKETNMKKN